MEPAAILLLLSLRAETLKLGIERDLERAGRKREELSKVIAEAEKYSEKLKEKQDLLTKFGEITN